MLSSLFSISATQHMDCKDIQISTVLHFRWYSTMWSLRLHRNSCLSASRANSDNATGFSVSDL